MLGAANLVDDHTQLTESPPSTQPLENHVEPSKKRTPAAEGPPAPPKARRLDRARVDRRERALLIVGTINPRRRRAVARSSRPVGGAAEAIRLGEGRVRHVPELGRGQVGWGTPAVRVVMNRERPKVRHGGYQKDLPRRSALGTHGPWHRQWEEVEGTADDEADDEDALGSERCRRRRARWEVALTSQ